jgi:hypothetical protein
MPAESDQIIERLRKALKNNLESETEGLIIKVVNSGDDDRKKNGLKTALKDAFEDEPNSLTIEIEKALDSSSEIVHPKLPWVKDMNQQYQKVMSTIISLSTAALILPIFFLRDLLKISSDEPIIKHLSNPKFLNIGLSYWSWIFLVLSILCAILFFYVSGNRLKEAWGSRVKRLFGKKISGKNTIQTWLYVFYDFSVFFFLIGVGFFVGFAVVNYSK